MIEISRGDLFKSDARTLVNPVNCVGTSGKGLAKEFKRRFPRGDLFYRNVCISGQLRIGEPVVWETPALSIVYFPTKDHWRHPSRLEYIEMGLARLRGMIAWGEIKESMAMPALGCGNGGLSFADVEPLIRWKLGDLKLDIQLFAPVE